jgi:hypothetical protein
MLFVWKNDYLFANADSYNRNKIIQNLNNHSSSKIGGDMSEKDTPRPVLSGRLLLFLCIFLSVLILILGYSAGWIGLPFYVLTNYQNKNCDSALSLNKYLSENYIEQDLRASQMNKSKPVLRFLTPTSRNTAAFRQPTEGSLDNPAPGGEARLTRHGTFLLWLIAPAPMVDVGDVIFQTHKDMHIFVIIAFVRTKVLFAVRALGDNVNNQIIGGPLVMFIGTRDKYGQGSSAFIHQEMNFAA